MNTLQNHLRTFLSPAKKTKNPAAARCRRKANRLGVSIEIERSPSGNGYWLFGTEWDDETFCTSWEEVEEKLDRFVKETQA